MSFLIPRSPRPLLASLVLLLSGFSASAAPERETGASTRLADELLPSSPSTNLEDLQARLGILGASETGLGELEAELDAGIGQEALAAWLRSTGIEEDMLAKAGALVQAYRDQRPVALLGLDLSIEDQLFVSELIGLGYDPGAAAWLTLEARQSGWPETPAERELLRPLVRRTATDLDLQDAVLDAALLRREAATLLAGDEARRRFEPSGELGETPLAEAATCRECPAWNYGLFLPQDEWQTHSASIEADECKVYRFAVTAGQAYQFSFCDGGGSASFDSLLRGMDTTCADLGSDDDSCGTSSDLVVTSPFTGYLYVQVSANGSESGEYTLAFRKDSAVAPTACDDCPSVDYSPGPPLPVWQTQASSIDSEGCRIFEFPLLLGHSYRFTTCEPGSGGSTSFDTVISSAIASQTCRPGPGNDDACADGGSTIEITPSFSQAVSIKVSGVAADEWGDFTLAFRDVTGECPTCPDSPTPALMPNATLQFYESSIPASDGCDLIPVMVEEGKSYRFSTCVEDGGASSFIADFSVLDGACTPLGGVTGAACVTPGLGMAWTFQPCFTGLVYLRIANAAGSAAGSYRLAYTELCSWVAGCRACIAQHGPLTPTSTWQTEAVYLPESGCRVLALNLEAYRTYRFSGCQGGGSLGAGQTVRFRIRQGDCSACMLNNAGDCTPNSPRVDFTPEMTGTYYLILEEQSAISGTVTVAYREQRVDCTNVDTSVAIPAGASGTVPGTVTVRTGARLHEFTGTPGRTYRFTLCPTDSAGLPSLGFTDPGLEWLMVNMTGGPDPRAPDAAAVLTSDDCPGQLDVVAPADGRIVIKVARRCRSANGDYEMDYRDATSLVVFATSGRYRGDLDGTMGPAGGDAICDFLAATPEAAPAVQAAVAAGSTFTAWLSDGAMGAYARLIAAGIPVDGYNLPDGTPVAASAPDLISPADLLHGIDQTERGDVITANFAVWSGTDEWGDPTGDDCTAWSVAFPTDDGTSGRADRVDGRWTDQLVRPCDRRRRLYCFEVRP